LLAIFVCVCVCSMNCEYLLPTKKAMDGRSVPVSSNQMKKCITGIRALGFWAGYQRPRSAMALAFVIGPGQTTGSDLPWDLEGPRQFRRAYRYRCVPMVVCVDARSATGIAMNAHTRGDFDMVSHCTAPQARRQ
jgi:hypothetical protein